MDKAEIIIYRDSQKSDFQIEVKLESDTVWLSQAQMAELFEASKQNISLHINNVFQEGEFNQSSTVKEYLTVQSEGVILSLKSRQVCRRQKAFSSKVRSSMPGSLQPG